MGSPLILSLIKQKNSCASRIQILSPAKINLYLNVTGKYSGSFHRIESVVERVSLFDRIEIEVKNNSAVRIFCDRKDLRTENNLCVKAAWLLKKQFKIPWGFDIFLKKNIPVGAGLGGGSSNAASTVLAINKLLNLNLKLKQLYELGKRLGSDVNFFLSQSSFAFIYGRGEKVIPFCAKPLRHYIVWPQVFISTKKVYNNTRVKLTKFFCNVKILKYALTKGDKFLIDKLCFNLLEKKALSLCGKLKTVKKCLNKTGSEFRLTGSGSAFYTNLERQEPFNIDAVLAGNNRFKLAGGANRWMGFDVHTF